MEFQEFEKKLYEDSEFALFHIKKLQKKLAEYERFVSGIARGIDDIAIEFENGEIEKLSRAYKVAVDVLRSNLAEIEGKV